MTFIRPYFPADSNECNAINNVNAIYSRQVDREIAKTESQIAKDGAAGGLKGGDAVVDRLSVFVERLVAEEMKKVTAALNGISEHTLKIDEVRFTKPVKIGGRDVNGS